MRTYSAPGVYYERSDANVGAIAPLRTDIAGFVGIARRGPLNRALPVESWRQFQAAFGDFTGAGYLAYAVRGFFENGGVRCWVVRAGSPVTASASSVFNAATPLPPVLHPWSVEASSPGVWGNDLEIAWHESHRVQTSGDPSSSTAEFLTVRSVAGLERGTHVRIQLAPGLTAYRVVSAVDSNRRRIYWVNPDPASRLPYELALPGVGPARPLLESIEYTLLVWDLGRLVAVFENLSLIPAHVRYGPDVLAPLAPTSEGRMSAIATDQAQPPVALVERRSAPMVAQLLPAAPDFLERRPLSGGLDGLAFLSHADFLGDPADILDDIDARSRKVRGLRVLEGVSEIAIVAIPDIHIQPVPPPLKRPPAPCTPDACLPPPSLPAVPRTPSLGDLPPTFSTEQVFQVQQALVEHCELLHDRFALLDPPFETVAGSGLGIGPMRSWRRRFDSDMAALYAPWVIVPDPLRLLPNGLRAIPPAGHVAGFIARTDRKLGVHRAPANAPLNWIQDVTLPVDDALHGILNPEHVNAIRALPGRGHRVFGARTLSSDPDWRFVPVRRLLLMLEKAILIGIQWAVFEPNNRFTRSKVHLALASLLLEAWRRGALAGRTPQEAFYVNCGERQNPAPVSDRGMLIAEVGVAPVTPYEFIVVRIGVSDNALEIAESGMAEVAS